MTKPHKITELFAWIVEHPNGEDGIPAILSMNQGIPMSLPLVGSDRERIESLRASAVECAAQGMPVKLCRFTSMEVLETLPIAPPGGRA